MVTIEEFHNWLAHAKPSTEELQERVQYLRKEMVRLRREAMWERYSVPTQRWMYVSVPETQLPLPGMEVGTMLATAIWPADRTDFGLIQSCEERAMALEKEFDLLRLELKKRAAPAA